MVEYKINFKTSIKNLESIDFHPLSTDGPYFDAHFGTLNSKTPVGQTYYIRPITEYIKPCENNMKNGCGCGGKGEGSIKFILKDCFPSVYANKNSVSNDFRISGSVKIYPFEWENYQAKIFNNQEIEVNLTVKNNTGLEMKGFHIHDGQNHQGLTSFGPISYFLYTTDEWCKLYNSSKKSVEFIKKNCLLPPNNIIQKNPSFLLNYSKKSIIK